MAPPRLAPWAARATDWRKHWEPDASRRECAVCSADFGSVLRRRHHCRCCGRVVCSDCSPAELILPRAIALPQEPSAVVTLRYGAPRRVCVGCEWWVIQQRDTHDARQRAVGAAPRLVERVLAEEVARRSHVRRSEDHAWDRMRERAWLSANVRRWRAAAGRGEGAQRRLLCAACCADERAAAPPLALWAAAVPGGRRCLSAALVLAERAGRPVAVRRSLSSSSSGAPPAPPLRAGAEAGGVPMLAACLSVALKMSEDGSYPDLPPTLPRHPRRRLADVRFAAGLMGLTAKQLFAAERVLLQRLQWRCVVTAAQYAEAEARRNAVLVAAAATAQRWWRALQRDSARRKAMMSPATPAAGPLRTPAAPTADASTVLSRARGLSDASSSAASWGATPESRTPSQLRLLAASAFGLPHRHAATVL